MAKLIMTIDGRYLYIRNNETFKRIRYDLKTNNIEKCRQVKVAVTPESTIIPTTESNFWYPVERAYKFFRGFTIGDIEFENPKFKQLLEMTRDLNSRCRSVSTFLDRMHEVMIYEHYIQEDVLFQKPYQNDWGRRHKYIFTHALREWNKNTINFFKKYRQSITVEMEGQYFGKDDGYESSKGDKEFIDTILNVALSLELTREQANQLIRYIFSSYYSDRLERLINVHKYKIKSLLNYCFNYLKPFENIDFSDAISLLKDYYDMGTAIARKVKKYPKYLKSMHDIITANYESYKREYNEPLFTKRMKPELVFLGKEFCIKIPKSSKDIVEEGTSLNHCVSSYVDRVIDGKTYIIFLRDSRAPDVPLVTVEYDETNKAIVQARGSYNRKLTKKEIEFLNEYCKKKEITLLVNE